MGWCLTGRERGPWLVVPLVVAAQAALHTAFSLAQSASGSALSPASGPAATDMRMGSMRMDSMDMGHMGHTSMSHMSHMGHAMGGDTSSFGMLAAHLLAALLTGLWLAYGERAAFRVLRAVAGWLAAPLRLLLALPVTGERPDRRLRRPRSDRQPSLDLLIHAITSRGPPVGTAVV